MVNDNEIAVVGMACTFPGAKDLDGYWNNIINKVNALKEAPNHRIDKVFYDPESNEPDRLYCNKGGFIDEYVDFDPIEFGLVPNSIKGTEPEQLLSLKMAAKALKDADIFEKNISLEKAGIIIGKAGIGGIETMKTHEILYGGESIVRLLKKIAPNLTNNDLNRIKKVYQLQHGNLGSQNVMGTVPNVVAAIVANRLNFGGPAYIIDAACASSIIAIDNAVKELQMNRCDLMIAGGIHLTQTPPFWNAFSHLGALSRTQVVRPFDKRADGVLPGEGCGFVVLRRLKDAIKDDQRIYALIKGVGLSSDGAHASLMSPSWQGQIKAIKSAWESSGLIIDQIGYLEAHGTATVLGDKTEITSLNKVFGQKERLPRAGIGSVKSMIGHTMPAAGIAGFIKTVMAVYHGVLPPTLNCDEPIDAFNKSRFVPIQDASDWSQTDLPYVAGVNAFGFGGANSHIIVKGFNKENKHRKKYNIPLEISDKDKVLLLARESKEELINAIEKNEISIGTGNYRIAVFNPTKKRRELAVRIINKDVKWRNKQDIWYTYSPLLSDGSKIAFVFPGLDAPGLSSIKKGNFLALADFLNVETSSSFDNDGLKLFYDLDESARLLDAALKKLGIEPDLVAGHSVGEWTACTTVGMVDQKEVNVINDRELRKDKVKLDVVFLSVSCKISEVEDLLHQHDNIYLSNDNCPNQFVLSGYRNEIESFQELLNERQIINRILPFETGYHSPLGKEHLSDLIENINQLISYKKPKTEIWSSITANVYPEGEEAVKQLQVDFITKPVLFRQLTENIYNKGVQVFIQIGAGSASGFIGETLNDKDISIVSASSSKREALSQVRRVLAALFIEGKDVDTNFLGISKEMDSKETKSGLNTILDLSLPFVDYNKVFSKSDISKLTSSKGNDEIDASMEVGNLGKALNENFTLMKEKQSELLNIIKNKKRANPENTLNHSLNSLLEAKPNIFKEIEVSFENYPELKDHVPFRKRSRITKHEHEGDAVIPLTMFLDLFLEILKEAYPQLSVHKIHHVSVYQFLWVPEKVIVKVVGKWTKRNEIQFEIQDYISATYIIGQENINNTSPTFEIKNSKTIPINASQVYSDGYMFHGESYQGIREINAYTDDMLETNVIELSGKGSLLDTIGQTIGVFSHISGLNIRPFPVGIGEMNFYSNPIDKSGSFICICKYKRADNDFIYSDVELIRNGKLWCSVKDWQVKKSEIDSKVWSMMTRAEDYYLSDLYNDQISIIRKDLYEKTNTWFTIQNIYLSKAESITFNQLTLSKKKEWLLGRIAAKDSIRRTILSKRGVRLHPASITITNDKYGQPLAQIPIDEEVYVSIAHKNGIAVSYSSLINMVGVDIEEVKPRDNEFYEMILNKGEKELHQKCEDKNEWITRFWVGKESYGKSIGLGLQGSPKNYHVTDINKNVLTIDEVEVTTQTYEEYIIGWTK